MIYDEWNDLLISHFFNPTMMGKRVRLNVTRQLLDEVGRPQGGDSDDFVQAVREGHDLAGVSLCLRAVHALELWHQRHILIPRPKYPLYFGYLCFFVLAAGEGEFSEAAYYPRLRQLLDEPETTGMYPHIEKTLQLWMELQHWSNTDQRGRLGLFHVVRRGAHPYVSLPRAQVLLSASERKRLHHVFLDAGIDPDRRPARHILASRVREFGSGVLGASVLRLLSQSGDFREYLLDDIEDELDQFEPTELLIAEEGQAASLTSQSRSRYADLLICLEVEPPRVRCRTRFLFNCEVPETDVEAGLSFANASGLSPTNLTCGGRFPGWSSILEAAPGVPFDAAILNWNESLHLEGRGSLKLKLRFDEGGIRVFASGLPEGLPGFIEAASLPSYGECFVAVSPEKKKLMEQWGQSLAATPEGSPLSEINVKMGLPAGWSLFHLQSVPTSRDVRVTFPGESGSETVRVLLRGGIRSPGLKSRYFAFAPPRIVLSGDCAGIEVTVAETKWTSDQSGVFTLPTDLCTPGAQLTVVIWRDHGMLATRRIELVDDGDGSAASDVHAMFGRDGASVAVANPDAAFAGCKIIEKTQAMVVSNDLPSIKLNAVLVEELSNQIKTAFEFGASSWSDPGGNRFVIVHRFDVLCLDEMKDRASLIVSVAAIKAAGFAFHEMGKAPPTPEKE